MMSSRPTHGFHLYEKNPLGLIQAVVDVLGDDVTLSLEGDLSPVAALLDGIPGMSQEPTATLPRQAIEPLFDFVIIPVTWNTIDLLKNTVLPAAALGTRVLHVQIAKQEQWQFGAYDLDHWGPGMHAQYSIGDAIPEAVLKQFVSRRLIRSYEPWRRSEPQDT